MTSGQRVLQQLLAQQGGITQQLLQVPTEQKDGDDSTQPAATSALSQETRLRLFSEALDEIDGGVSPRLSASGISTPSVISQALPLAVSSYQDPAQQVGISHGKEFIGGSQSAHSAELPGGMQYAEVEHAAELPPEVEKYIEQVTDNSQNQPQMVVVAEKTPHLEASTPTAPRVVKVLPLTKVQEEIGLKKNPTFSVRWLVEFSHKIAKMFFGGVVYKQSDQKV